LDIVAVTPDSLRMDATGTLGVALATLVINKNDVQYSIYRQKKYYEGRLSDHAMRPLFKMNMNPKFFMNLCTDSAINEPGWVCQIGNNGLVDSCERKSDGFKIIWSDREGDRKRVTISDKDFQLTIVFKSYTELDQTKVQANHGPFQYEPPKDFARYKIP